jgi:diguanylate cyclase (GGDEF)-like protein
LIDCDRLKSINTKYGHAIGDKALRYIAGSISENTRTTDAVARIGGDEFLLLLPETHVSKATIVAEKIRQKISSSKVWTSLGPVHVSISAGVSAIPSNIEKIEDILLLLSAALRSSKEEGRDRVIASEWALLPNNAVSGIDYKKQ